jgi:hypothetical protein
MKLRVSFHLRVEFFNRGMFLKVLADENREKCIVVLGRQVGNFRFILILKGDYHGNGNSRNRRRRRCYLVLYDQGWWTERIKPIRCLSRAAEKKHHLNSGPMLNQPVLMRGLCLSGAPASFLEYQG